MSDDSKKELKDILGEIKSTQNKLERDQEAEKGPVEEDEESLSEKIRNKFKKPEREKIDELLEKFEGQRKKLERVSTAFYNYKPTNRLEFFKILILPLVAVIIGLILTFVLGWWFIGIPIILIGSWYLIFELPDEIAGKKIGPKTRLAIPIIIAGALLISLSITWYGLGIIILGASFIAYEKLEHRGGRLAAKIIELGVILAILIFAVPTFLAWAGITIDIYSLFLLSAINTFILFLFWSFEKGQSVKESLEEELLKLELQEKRKEFEEEESHKEAKEKHEVDSQEIARRLRPDLEDKLEGEK